VVPPLVAVVGPTAAGKSALALRLALERGGEIVSCDSLQVYRGLDIGSAKPTPEERRAVSHHLVDVVGPDEAFSAAEYARSARAALEEIRGRGRLAIVAGGTGLYLKALLYGLSEGPSRDEPLRRRLESMASRFGRPRLHRLLRRVDPASAARIQPGDAVRSVRALEVYLLTGRTIGSLHERGGTALAGFRVKVLGISPGRSELRRSVETRTRAMLERGLVDEVRRLVSQGLSPEARPLGAIGYRQALAVVRGQMSEAEAEGAIVRDTMRFAKRQMTWFRHQADVHWVRDREEGLAAALSFVDAGTCSEAGR
jgi:tRNA dimethylallyltransferase